MKNKKLLIVFALLLLVCCIVLSLVALFVLVINKDDKDSDDTGNGQNQDNEDDQAQDEVDMYAYANCKVYKLTSSAATEVAVVNKTTVNCFNNMIFRNSYAFVNPSDADQNGKNDLYLLDVKKAEIVKIAIGSENWVVGEYDSASAKLYTYVLKGEFSTETHAGAVYEGTIANPFVKKVFEPKGIVQGRGISFSDRVSLNLSPDKQKLLIHDTFSEPLPGGTFFKDIQVIDLTGTRLSALDGNFPTWVDNDRFVYRNREFQTTVAVFNTKTSQETTLVNLNRTQIFAINVLGDYVSVDCFGGDDGMSTLPNITYVYDVNTKNLVKELSNNAGFYKFLDSDTLVAKSVIACSGSFEDNPNAPYSCPMEGPFDFYEKGIVSVVRENNQVKTLLEFDKKLLASIQN